MKITSSIAVTVIITALILNTADAQLTINTSYQKNLKTRQQKNADTIENDNQVLNNIKLSAVRDFLKRFPAIINAKWYTVDDGGFIAKFNTNAIENTVAYNQSGNWVYTIKRYDENDMSHYIRAIIKRTYYDYSILRVEEIADAKNNEAVFIVHVRDTSTIKILRICNENLDVLHTYKRGDK